MNNRFYPNALVRTYCYQFDLFTLSFLLLKISYYFSLNCHLNGHTDRKRTVEIYFTYLPFVFGTTARFCGVGGL